MYHSFQKLKTTTQVINFPSLIISIDFITLTTKNTLSCSETSTVVQCVSIKLHVCDSSIEK